MFRETLLCRETLQPNWSMAPDSVRVLHIGSPARVQLAEGQTTVDIAGESEITYRGPSGMTVNTKVPLLKATMKLLQDAYPATIPFDLLRRQSRELLGGDPNDPRSSTEDSKLIAVGLLNCYMSSDVIEFHGMPISFQRTVSAKPLVMPIARLMVQKGAIMPNRRHEVVRLDELDIHMIPMLDGTNDRASILNKLTDLGQRGTITVNKDNVPLTDPAEIRSALDSILDRRLQNVTRMAVMIG
jgi:methyltransferase-like protein